MAIRSSPGQLVDNNINYTMRVYYEKGYIQDVNYTMLFGKLSKKTNSVEKEYKLFHFFKERIQHI